MAAASYQDFQTISIDFDVFKALTAHLEGPSDTYNAVLRRLLDLPTVEHGGQAASPAGGRSWDVGGASFPHGTEFRREFKGQLYTARVEDGALVYRGERFDSPSRAAMEITNSGVNGWFFWECRVPGRGWVSMDAMRRK